MDAFFLLLIILERRNVQVVDHVLDSGDTPPLNVQDPINRYIICPFMCEERFASAEELIAHIVRNHKDCPEEAKSSGHEPKAGMHD